MELLDEEIIKAINTASKPVPLHPISPSLFIKFAGSPAHTAEDQRFTLDIISHHGANMDAIHKSKDASEVETLWESRKIALWSALQVKGEGYRDWGTDVCVPIAKLPELVKSVKKDLQDHQLFGPIVGHVGDGNFHAALIYKDGDAKEMEKIRKVVHRVSLPNLFFRHLLKPCLLRWCIWLKI